MFSRNFSVSISFARTIVSHVMIEITLPLKDSSMQYMIRCCMQLWKFACSPKLYNVNKIGIKNFYARLL